jgi:hypothetical protein
MNALPKDITPRDLETKFRELQGGVESAGESAKSYAITVGAIAVVAVVGVAYLLGRRRGKKRSTVVEVRRI